MKSSWSTRIAVGSKLQKGNEQNSDQYSPVLCWDAGSGQLTVLSALKHLLSFPATASFPPPSRTCNTFVFDLK